MNDNISELINPNLISELKKLEFRTRRSVDADLLGKYKSAFRGTGLQYSDLREYQPGDDVRSIHWKVTARTGKVYVKDYEEDRQLTILVCLDSSRSTIFGTTRSNQSRMAEFAALVLLLARQNNDKIGLALFDQKVSTFIPPRQSSRNQFLKLLKALTEVRQAVAHTDIAGSMDYILSHQRRKAIVFFLSDFYSSNFEEQLRKLSIRHETICVHSIDESQSDPPAIGLVSLQDAETGQLTTIDTNSKFYRKEIQRTTNEHSSNMEQLCRNSGCDYIKLTDNPMKSLSELMRRRTARMV